MTPKENVIMSRDKAGHSSTPWLIRSGDDQIASGDGGFTLLELIAVMAILATLILLAIPFFGQIKDRVRNVRAMEEIRGIEKVIIGFSIDNGGNLPANLTLVGQGNARDPWGNTYVYVPNIGPAGGRYGSIPVPLNDDFDLYSSGSDGATSADPTTRCDVAPNKDDIIRAGDGNFVGLGDDL